MLDSTLCPYCASRPADSDDHVFPRFLGGKARIPACTNCNNTFGQSFEAACSRHFREWMFLFRRCGMQPPTPVVWKGIARDEMGRRYDVDQDFRLRLSKPEISRDASGRITRVVGDKKSLSLIARSLQKTGQELRLNPGEKITIDVRQHPLTQPIDADIKRLCLKMSIAASRRFDLSIPMNRPVVAYLLDAKTTSVCPVSIALDHYEELDRQRPRLGHVVYVRANRPERRIYSVVQFFGVMQFYCELADEWTGEDHSILATHDPISHEEVFRSMTAVEYAVAPVDRETYSKKWAERLERMRLELVAIYGDQAPVSLRANL